MPPKKKIVSIVSYAILPYTSGGQKSIAQFNEYLGSLCDFWVVSTSSNDIKLAKNYTLLPWMKPSLLKFFQVSLFFKLSRFIKANGIQYFLLEHPYMGWLGWLIKIYCKIPLVVHTHNIEYLRFKSVGKKWWPILFWYEKKILSIADIVFCISEEDRQFMIGSMRIKASKCHVVTFGLPLATVPTDKISCADEVRKLHGIAGNEAIILFNGALNYFPNHQAVKEIVENINPILLQSNLKYKIIICGKGLPASFNGLKDQLASNIIYTGLVPDIELYFKGASIFINPVQSGGGIKTKLVEALGFNTTVVSTETGALGFDKAAAGNKLVAIKDNDWAGFATAIIQLLEQPIQTPATFYDKYYWGNIAQKALAAMVIGC